MNRRYAFLFALGLAVSVGAASLQRAPGYMDADFYQMGGLNLAEGRGFEEEVLWNYLDDPAGLPHPSHGYWMPLASILAAAGLRLAPARGFDSAQWGFILVASLIPPLTAALAYQLAGGGGTPPLLAGARRVRAATLAGLLAVFPGYYLGPLTTTDTFGLVMLLGAVFFLAAKNSDGKWYFPLALGALAALMHLARADGALWLMLGLAAILPKGWRAAGWLVGGYLMIMTPWFLRNLAAFGTFLAPGGARALWWTRYDELFAYPADLLTPARWWASGWAVIVGARLSAGWDNLQSAMAVQGMIFLFPLMLWGLWRLRSERVVRLGVLAWGLGYAVMSLVFPFAGTRGGFFHSGAGVQTLLWAVVPVGLDGFVAWAGVRRGWKFAEARRVFGAAAIFLAALISAVVFGARIAEGPGEVTGYAAPGGYVGVEIFIKEAGARPEDIIMVNNPPGYFVTNRRAAIVIPDGGAVAVLAAGRRYGARFLALEATQGMTEIYDHPEDWPGLTYLGETEGVLIFEFEQ